jgi:hypothetical protein
LDPLKDRVNILESLATEVDKLRPLIAQVQKIEEQATAFPTQYARLENVDVIEQRASKLENETKVLHGKVSNSTKGWRTEAAELKAKTEVVLGLANNTTVSGHLSWKRAAHILTLC